MITTNKLKFWTILTHAIIVIGAGHGVLTLSILEIISIHGILKEGIYLNAAATVNEKMNLVSIFSFGGQALIIVSMFIKQKLIEIIFLLAGLLLLWQSVFYFWFNISDYDYVYIATITVIPFLINTMRILAGRIIQKSYRKIITAIKD